MENLYTIEGTPCAGGGYEIVACVYGAPFLLFIFFPLFPSSYLFHLFLYAANRSGESSGVTADTHPQVGVEIFCCEPFHRNTKTRWQEGWLDSLTPR